MTDSYVNRKKMMAASNQDAKDAVRKQYGAAGDAYVRSAGHASGPDLVRMVELAEPSVTDEMLDIATGGGHVPRAFAPHVGSIVATDLTPEILAHAGQAFDAWGIANVTTAIADAEALPFADTSFDLVTCRIAPHHFPDPAAFVREVFRVLRPGGRFLLIDSTVAEGDAGARFNRFEKLRDPSHVRALAISEWETLLADAGFTVDHVEPFEKRHDFEDWVTRSRTSDANRRELARMIRDDPETFRAGFASDDPAQPVAFHDTKTLFRARKAR